LKKASAARLHQRIAAELLRAAAVVALCMVNGAVGAPAAKLQALVLVAEML
jgi:hypothetical protein